ncbi:MAG: biosynthetic-type acetolactate synthase large subunit [candidate division NC10 bacterium]|nr:biosynthetic-type acetolactate synthase large subunit [candidate division NC10 bacterium]
MKLTGAKIFVESLLREGVNVIFGLPGGAVLSIYDTLYDSSIKHILVRHEQAAAHAADGYARATGKVGVSLVTSGPGATNTVTGVASAYMDSIPIVVFTGQVPTPLIGNDAFQEADIVGMTRPCTKHSYLVKDIRDLARTIKEAFHIASTGRPGPVLVDLPKDVILSETVFHYPDKVSLRSYNPTYEGHTGQINKAAKAILKAKRPIIYVGGGVIRSGASAELLELAELTKIPVTTTLMGLGAFPGQHPLSLGMLGMHGAWYTNTAVTHSDLIIAVGARFDDRVTGKIDEFAPEALIIHIDIDPSAISKNVQVDIPIVGDAKNVLIKLNQELAEATDQTWKEAREHWLRQIKVWKEKHPLRYDWDNNVIKPQYVVEEISRLTNGEAIIATGVGQNQMWTAQFYHFKRPGTFLTSGGLGAMGYGFPAAMGAQAAFPDKLVIDIDGDGSFQMMVQELATVVEYNLPVKVAILNNQHLGMVRQWQELFFKERYSQVNLSVSPDYVKLAEAYGAVGLRATRPEEVTPVLMEAFSTPRPVVIDFQVDPMECVFPMVPAGAGIKDMLLEKPKKEEKKLKAVK